MSKLSPGEMLKQLRAIGVRKHAELTPQESIDLPVLGACTRPTEAERTAIRERVLGWIGREWPRERDGADGSALQLRFGCVEPAGIVVDAQVDRISPRGNGTPDVGHWCTLRITPGAIKLLANVSGVALTNFMEWTNERTLATVALADLDRDGTLDALVADEMREGGSSIASITLSLMRSRTGTPKRIAELGDEVALAGGAAAGAVVVRIRDNDGLRFRCIDTPLVLGRCPEADAARNHDRAIAAADRLVGLQGLPDHDELVELLDALAIPLEQQAPLLASTPPTTEADRVVRAIAAFTLPIDNRTNRERIADAQRSGQALLADVRGDLGDVPCVALRDDDVPISNVIRSRSPVAKGIQLRERCTGARDGYGVATWNVVNSRVEGVFHVRAGRARLLVSSIDSEPLDPTTPPTQHLEVAFYKRGDATIAVVLENHSVLEVFANGASIERMQGSFSWLMLDDVRSDLVWDSASPDHTSPLHADDRAISSPASPRLVEYLRRAQAREVATHVRPGQFGDAAYRDELAQALALLGADPALVASVQQLR